MALVGVNNFDPGPRPESGFDKVVKALQVGSNVLNTGANIADSYTKWKAAQTNEEYRKTEEAKLMSDVAKAHDIITPDDPRYANAIALNPSDPNSVRVAPKIGISYEEANSGVKAGFGKIVSPDDATNISNTNGGKSPTALGYAPIKDLKGFYYDPSQSKDNPIFLKTMSEVAKNNAEAAAKGREKEQTLDKRASEFAKDLSDPTSRSSLGREAYTNELGLGVLTLTGDLDNPNATEKERMDRYNKLALTALPELAASVATLINRGNQSTEGAQQAYTPSSLEIEGQKLLQKLTNTSKPAEAGSFIKQLADIAKRQIDINQNVLAQRAAALGNGYDDLRSNRPEQFKRIINNAITIDARRKALDVLNQVKSGQPGLPPLQPSLNDHSVDDLNKLSDDQIIQLHQKEFGNGR